MPLIIDQIESGKLVDAVSTEIKSIESTLSTISKIEELATLIKQIVEMRLIINDEKFQPTEKTTANEITNILLSRILIIERALAQQKTTIDEITERLREKKRAFLPEALVGPQGPLKSTELNDFQKKIQDQKNSAVEQAKEDTRTNISPLIEQIFNQATNYLIEAATNKLKEYLSKSDTDLTPENIKAEITRLQEYASFIQLNILNTDDKNKHLENIDAIKVVLSKRIAAFDISFFINSRTFSPAFLEESLMKKTMATGYVKVAAYASQFKNPDYQITYADVKNIVDFLERNRNLISTLSLDTAAVSIIEKHTQTIELTLANTVGRLLVQNPPQQPLLPKSPYTYAVKLYFLLYGNELVGQLFKHKKNLAELTRIEKNLNLLEKKIQRILNDEQFSTLIRSSHFPQNSNPNLEEPAATGLKDDSGQDDLVKQEKYKRNTLRLDHYPQPKEITTFSEMLVYLKNYLHDLKAHWFVKNGRAFITLFLKSGTLEAIDLARFGKDYLAFVKTCKQLATLIIKFPTCVDPEAEANAIFSNEENMTVKKMLLHIEIHYSRTRTRISEKMMALLNARENEEANKKEATAASDAATIAVDSSSSDDDLMEPPPELVTPDLLRENTIVRTSHTASDLKAEEINDLTVGAKGEDTLNESVSSEEESEADEEVASNSDSSSESGSDSEDDHKIKNEVDEQQPQHFPAVLSQPTNTKARTVDTDNAALPPSLTTTSDPTTESASSNNSPRANI